MKKEWSFRRELRPRAVPGLVRLGNPLGDGGYVVPEWVVESTDVLLTLGIGREWTFEEHVHRMRPEASIIGADHTVHANSIRSSLRQARIKHELNRLLGRAPKAARYAERIDRYRSYLRLFTTPNVHIERAVGSVSSQTTVTVHELFAHVQSNRPHGVLVSMDIEGCEYEVIEDILEYHAAINMIVAEFHGIGLQLDAFERSIREAKNSFEIVHVHGNNCAPYNYDLDMPEVVEVTFVHRSLMPAGSPYSVEERPLPGLDMPNSPRVPDYALRL
jgi:hypothetical protein